MNAQAGSLQTLCPHCGTINRIEQSRLGQKPNCGRCHKAPFLTHPASVAAITFVVHGPLHGMYVLQQIVGHPVLQIIRVYTNA